MDGLWWVVPAVVAAVGLLIFAWRPLRAWGREVQVERAREAFRLQRERLEAKFFDAAAGSGRPKGLRWVGCDFEAELELARDRQTGLLLGLVPVTIRFEAIEGGDMEGVAAVGNLRAATAVFAFERGHWTTAGKAVFNMTPAEAIRHFGGQYDKV